MHSIAVLSFFLQYKERREGPVGTGTDRTPPGGVRLKRSVKVLAIDTTRGSTRRGIYSRRTRQQDEQQDEHPHQYSSNRISFIEILGFAVLSTLPKRCASNRRNTIQQQQLPQRHEQLREYYSFGIDIIGRVVFAVLHTQLKQCASQQLQALYNNYSFRCARFSWTEALYPSLPLQETIAVTSD